MSGRDPSDEGYQEHPESFDFSLRGPPTKRRRWQGSTAFANAGALRKGVTRRVVTLPRQQPTIYHPVSPSWRSSLDRTRALAQST